MKISEFTKDEIDVLYTLVRDEYDELMRGDWDSVRTEIGALHLIMHKILKEASK